MKHMASRWLPWKRRAAPSFLDGRSPALRALSTAKKHDGAHRTVRAIAAFEACKGAIALAASLGLLSLLHHDLHRLAATLIGHVGLDPGAHYPAMLLDGVDQLGSANLKYLLLAAGGYVLVRFVEAYGLWKGRTWGEWLGALSGAVYVPFELRHLLHRPTLAAAAVIGINVAVVCFLGWQLWCERVAMRSSSG
jgi:uncharacterized membrane protein (DUF2068 family)